MKQTLSFRQIFVGAVAMLTVSVAGSAAAGTQPDEQKGGCVNPRPGHDFAMAGKNMRKYGDYRTNPDHTQRQFERARLDLERRVSCDLWVAATARVGVGGYKAHQLPQSPIGKKLSSHDEAKKRLLATLPDDRVLTAKENLKKRMIGTTVDLAYQGRSREEIIRQLYCGCLSEYPDAVAFDKKATERRMEDIDSDE